MTGDPTTLIATQYPTGIDAYSPTRKSRALDRIIEDYARMDEPTPYPKPRDDEDPERWDGQS